MSRLSGFQLDRAKLDSHMLELAFRFCCDLWRHAKVTGFELNDGNGQTVNAVVDGEERTAACRWIIDATGRAAMFARKLGYFARIPSTALTRCGRALAASKNGTATNGANV